LKHGSEDNIISKNVIAHNNWNGITLKPGSKGNIIMENTIGSNFYAGIGISEASYNYIYHNNFMENRYNAYDDATNVWDDGYPSGGNYWDDYQGCDKNSDGMGDTPYQILDGFNTDRYPYIAPYTGSDTIPPIVKITSPQNGLYLRDLRLFPRLFRHQTILLGDITIEVDASDVHSGIAKVEFYLDDPMHPIAVDEEAPYSWTWAKGSFLHHQHTITVIAYDTAGNYNMDSLEVRRYF
jgi:parallel beta-helix repeat protein